MNNQNLLATLTAKLNLTTNATGDQLADKLGSWVDTHVPALTNDATAVLHNWNWAAVTTLVDETVRAAQDLKGIFDGVDRAEIGVVTVLYVIDLVLPEPARTWVQPLLTDEVLLGMIEAAYRKIFGVTAPVTDDPSVKPGALE